MHPAAAGGGVAPGWPQGGDKGVSAATAQARVEFEIPWVPPTLNQLLRLHWSKRRKMAWTAGAYLIAAGLSRRQPGTRSRVRVTIQMYRKNPTDRDGAQGSCKVFFDIIRRAGWAVDDSEKWMEQDVLPVIVDRRRPRTKVIIEEI